MVFSSGLFLFYFFPIFLLGYLLIPQKWKNPYALVGSLGFYTWGAPEFLVWVIVGILVDYIVSRQIHSNERLKSIQWLWLGLALNLGLLLYFKYANFFVLNLFQLLGFDSQLWVNVILPLGISFFTFQKMSYLIDVYRKEVEASQNIVNYALYVLLFPQLIAGPIVRYKEIAAQLLDRSKMDRDVHEKLAGLTRFAIGLAKKVLIADVLGRQVDQYFGQEDLSSPMAWIILLSWAMQIYFDFSGYSDMAIGLGRMMGFTFPENFNFPYLASSITDFWRKWHITLSNWMRDYLYIPLGGSRGLSQGRIFVNLWIVFLVSGLWHGASWNFIIWGAMHGFFLSLDRLAGGELFARLGKIPSVLLTFLLSLLTWVVFRAEDLSESIQYYTQLFAFEGEMIPLDSEFWTVFFLAAILLILPALGPVKKHYLALWENRKSLRFNFLQFIIIATLMALSVSEVMMGSYSPFIYFIF